MRVIVSTIGTLPYVISKYLVDIIQPTLNKNQHEVKSSKSFVSQAQTWKIEQDEIQDSYDVTNLYPSIPIAKAIDVILQQLSEDYEDLKTRTKLTLVDIQQLIELCVNGRYYFGTMLFEIYLIQDQLVFQYWWSYQIVIYRALKKCY